MSALHRGDTLVRVIVGRVPLTSSSATNSRAGAAPPLACSSLLRHPSLNSQLHTNYNLTLKHTKRGGDINKTYILPTYSLFTAKLGRGFRALQLEFRTCDPAPSVRTEVALRNRQRRRLDYLPPARSVVRVIRSPMSLWSETPFTPILLLAICLGNSCTRYSVTNESCVVSFDITKLSYA